MADLLIVHDLVVEGRVGAYAWEREQAQQLWIDLELRIDARRAARADRVEGAVDYARLLTVVRSYVGRTTVHLIETVAQGIAELVLRELGVAWVRVRVKKRALEGVDYTGVEIVRRAGRIRRAVRGRGRRRGRPRRVRVAVGR